MNDISEKDQTQIEEALGAEELDAMNSELVGDGTPFTAPERDPYSVWQRFKFWFGLS